MQDQAGNGVARWLVGWLTLSGSSVPVCTGSEEGRQRRRQQAGLCVVVELRRVGHEAEAVLGRSVEAGKKSQEAGLRRRSRDLPAGQAAADEARLGDGGAIVFQRARQIGGVQRTGGLFGQCSRAGAGAGRGQR